MLRLHAFPIINSLWKHNNRSRWRKCYTYYLVIFVCRLGFDASRPRFVPEVSTQRDGIAYAADGPPPAPHVSPHPTVWSDHDQKNRNDVLVRKENLSPEASGEPLRGKQRRSEEPSDHLDSYSDETTGLRQPPPYISSPTHLSSLIL